MRPAERQRVPTTKKRLAPEVLATFASHGRDHRLTAGGFFPAPVIGKRFVIPGIHYFDAHRLRPAASSFFFLDGRCRTVARSLHEHKQ